MQPDFDLLCSETSETRAEARAETAPRYFTLSFSSLATLKTASPPNHTVLSQQDDEEGRVHEQMQELISLWNSRRTNVIPRPESRVSSSASTIIQTEDTSFLPAPRRYHPAVWKTWTRHLANMAVESVKRELRDREMAPAYIHRTRNIDFDE